MPENDIALRRSKLSPVQQTLLEKRLSSADERRTIKRRERPPHLPVSFAQQRLWFLDQLEPDSPLYNINHAVRIAGRLEVDALKRSFEEVSSRQESLRTSFATVGGEPVQIINPCEPFALPLIDLRHLPPAERRSEGLRLASEENRRPFNLSHPPLLRAKLLWLAEDEHWLLFTMHHIISDAWSFGVLMNEMAAFYNDFAAGRSPVLPPLPIQYADFAVWQREWLRGEVLERHLSYWRRQLKNVPAVLDLPIYKPRPATQNHLGARQLLPLPPSLVARLRALCREQNVTMFMLLLAAFKVLLYRYAQQEDIVVGTPIAGRDSAEVEGLIGFFVNTLALRTDLSGDPTFRELLGRVRETALEAYAHREVPFEELVKELQPTRDLSHTPLFQVVFMLDDGASTAARMGDLQLSVQDVESELSKFDLTLSLRAYENGYVGAINYRIDLFDAETIARMAGHYQTMLESIVADPEARLSELELLSEEERHLHLVKWNQTAVEFPRERTIHEMFEEQAARTPEAEAVVCEGERVSYGELNERANKVARYLRKVGVRADERVGVLMERSVEMVVGLLGVMKAGGCYVPLDPQYPRERLAFMMADARPRVVLTLERVGERLGQEAGAEQVRLDAEWAEIERESGENVGRVAEAENLAYVIYTSGSTGRPKGILLHHRGLCNLIIATNKLSYVDAGSRVLQFSSPSFDVSVWEIFMALIAGATLCLGSRDTFFSSERLVEIVKRHGVTVALLPPSLLRVLRVEDFPTLRTIIAVGEKCTTELIGKWAPGRYFFNDYGPAEGSVTVSTYLTDARVTHYHGPPIGKPIANVRLYVLDRHLQPVPVGVAGELHLGGVCVARGYLNRPELTAEKFVPDPFDGGVGERLYKTGDLARYLPDGNLQFVGRVDHQEKVRGYRIEMGEVETVLSKHPLVRQCMVLAREDSAGNKRLVAYVIGEQGEEPSAAELRGFLQMSLPDYMLPSAFEAIEKWPLTPNGKVDREALPKPTVVRLEQRDELLAPQTQMERTIAGVLQGLLMVEQIGIQDNFFDLGLHSLSAVQAQLKLQELLQMKVPVVELFKHPTVESLAKALGRNESDELHLGDLQERARQRKQAKQHQQQHLERRGRRQMASTDSINFANAIAVVSMAGRFPGAKNIDEFWRNLCAGVESIQFFTREELLAEGYDPALVDNPSSVGAYGVLDDVELFDGEFFGFTPREAELLDPQQRIFLECAWEAVERAGYDPTRYEGLIGLYAGTSMSSYLLNLLSSDQIRGAGYGMQLIIGNDKDHLATRVSFELNLKGPSVTVQTACSTSLVAVHLACQSLLDYQCDMALAGGVSVSLPQKKVSVYVEGGLSSSDGHCRAFDAKAEGPAGGNGVGIVLLKRLADALEDGDTIHAVVRGSAINNDGAQKAGYTAPSVYGQAVAIAAAQVAAEVDVETISYVEAHGTATALGDPIEIASLTRAFRASTQRKNFCAIGSVKTNVGHLDAAAGVAGFIKTVLSLRHKLIPPSLNFTRPNPHIDFENSPFYVNTKLSEWKTNGAPRRAGVSSFGLGGTNAHVIVEESPGEQIAAPSSRPFQLLVLSAQTNTALGTATDNLAAHLRDNPEANLADVAYTLQVGRRGFAHRRAVVCRDAGEAASQLSEHDARHVLDSRVEVSPPPVVFMFPGLGNHYVGMGWDLYCGEPVFRKHVEHCCALLKPHLGCDLRDVIYPDWRRGGTKPQTSHDNGQGEPRQSHSPAPAAATERGDVDLRRMLRRGEAAAATEDDEASRQLNQTKFTQPALFVIEYALAQFWLELGVRPQAMIGYSIGEYVAACLAGVMSLEDALMLLAARAQMIQELPPGAMLAVPLSEQDLRPLLSGRLHLAAVNGPSVCVLTGEVEAVSEVERDLSARGVACRRLATAHAFHSPLMETTIERFTDLLKNIRLRAPGKPFVSNLTGQWITEAQATDATYWARHMCEPVRFGKGLETLWAQQSASEMVLLEVGPGQALSAWALQHPESARLRQRMALPTLRHSYEHGSDVAYFLKTLGKLWLAGVEIEWAKLHAPERRRRVPLPTYPFERRRYWVELQGQDQAAAFDPRRRDSARSQKKSDLADWFYLPVWKQSRLLTRSATREVQGEESAPGPDECCLVLADGCGLGEQLAARLEASGQTVIVVKPGGEFERTGTRHFNVNPGAREDYDRLLAELAAAGQSPKLIVHSWSVSRDEAKLEGRDRFEQAQQTGFYGLLYLAQALAARGLARNASEDDVGSLRIYALSNNVQEVSGAEALCPEKATLIGVCKSIPQEYPNVMCVSVDVVLPPPGTWREQRLVEQLSQEFAAPPADMVVAYRENSRWTQTFEPVRLEQEDASPARLRKRGVYWLTGGLGRDSLVRARYLAEEFQSRLVLSGRTALPPREEWERWLAIHGEPDETSVKIRKVLELEELGAEVLVVEADVASLEQMRAAVARIDERFGELHGVIHAAGATTSEFTKQIAELSRVECEAHFRAKVYGLYVLEEVLRDRELDFCLLTSSIASIIGGVGLLAYTSASNFMDAFAHAHNQTSPRPWTSMNWQGATPQNTVEAFRRILSIRPLTQVTVSAEDLEASIEQRIKLKFLRDARPSQLTLHSRPLLLNACVAPRNDTERQIVEVWQTLMGIEQIGIHDSFLELGGDSLLALQLTSRLGKIFNVELQTRSLFETPTVAGLADSIDRAGQMEALAERDAVSSGNGPRTLAGGAREMESSLVRIQPGGAKRPFFCVHPAGGNVFCYVSLAQHLGTEQPFYGLQSPGLSRSAAHAPSTVEEMAAHYLEELRGVQPVGPYQLGGWSMGGLVAYEMAGQLRARGEAVALLALIDISTTLGKTVEVDDLSVTANFAQELALSWNQRPSGMTRAELLRLETEQQLAWILEQARKTDNVPAGFGLDELRRLREVFKVNVLAMRNYIPQPYAGKVTLLKAEEGTITGAEQPGMGWEALSAAGVEIHLVPGNHYTMVRGANARVLAERLGESIG